MGTIIEICGVDGSGKSTLISGLRSRCAHEGFSTIERRPRLMVSHFWSATASAPSAGAALAAPRFWMSFGEFITRVAPELTQLSALSSKRLVIFADGYLVNLLTEGLRALSSALEREQLLSLLARLTAPELAIVLEVQPDEALKRIRARGGYDSVLAGLQPAAVLEERQGRLLEAAKLAQHSTAIIDANRDARAVLEEAWAQVSAKLPR